MATRKPLVVISGQVQEQPAGDVPAGAEPTITAGTTAQYWCGDKSWRDFFTDVRGATLTGLSTATNAVIAASDTVLAAFGKIQAQINTKAPLASPSFTGAVKENGADVVVQTDIGGSPNELPLNQHLGGLAYMSPEGLIIRPQASVAPAGIGDAVFQLTNNTTLVIKVKGSDGVVRSATLTLA